jgi:hypothetical protein
MNRREAASPEQAHSTVNCSERNPSLFDKEAIAYKAEIASFIAEEVADCAVGEAQVTHTFDRYQHGYVLHFVATVPMTTSGSFPERQAFS